MNTTPQVLVSLCQSADRQARQIRQLRHFQLVQGVTLLILGLVQIIHTFMLTRGLQ